jgi:tripartite-type tricarboxylate transporter receptor subunit TctC
MAAIIYCLLAGLFLAAHADYVYAQDLLLKGKTIRIIVGFPSGGGSDAEGRVLARHLGKHIPGEPSLIVQNMPGAGGMVASN